MKSIAATAAAAAAGFMTVENEKRFVVDELIA